MVSPADIVTQVSRLTSRHRLLAAGAAATENDQLVALLDASRALDAANIPHALIGGIAVGIRSGLPRATVDVALAVRTTNVDELVFTMTAAGFSHRGNARTQHQLPSRQRRTGPARARSELRPPHRPGRGDRDRRPRGSGRHPRGSHRHEGAISSRAGPTPKQRSPRPGRRRVAPGRRTGGGRGLVTVPRCEPSSCRSGSQASQGDHPRAATVVDGIGAQLDGEILHAVGREQLADLLRRRT